MQIYLPIWSLMGPRRELIDPRGSNRSWTWRPGQVRHIHIKNSIQSNPMLICDVSFMIEFIWGVRSVFFRASLPPPLVTYTKVHPPLLCLFHTTQLSNLKCN